VPPRRRPDANQQHDFEQPSTGGADPLSVSDTRSRILAAAKSSDSAVNAASAGARERAALELLGDAHLRAGDLEKARDAYVRAKATDKLNALAESAPAPDVSETSSGEADEETEIKEDRDVAVSEKERILWLQKGEAELLRGRYGLAISSYRKAGADERLVEIGDDLVRREYKWHRLGFRAYRLAGARDRILANADKYPGGPIRAYMAVAARDALRAHLDGVLDGPRDWRESPNELFKVYKGYRYLGGPTERILQVAERLLAHGEERLAMTAFRAAAQLRLQDEKNRQEPS